MEHFSQDMQNILDEYCKGDINLQELDRTFKWNPTSCLNPTTNSFSDAGAYKEVGTEGHDVTAYKEVLEFVRSTLTHNPSHASLER